MRSSADPRLLVVVGARPNFVKVAPLLHALSDTSVDAKLLHTGQHYDYVLCRSFLELLEFPEPDFELEVGSGSHAQQTAAVMIGCEEVLRGQEFDAVLVPGDVNSTLGAALAASKLACPVIHLESGLRSGDSTMPEEVNRIVTDRLSSLLLCHCEEAVDNLASEGIGRESVHMIGNTMIDSLLRLRDGARSRRTLQGYGLEPGGYILVTLHRPATVDDAERLRDVVEVLRKLSAEMPVVFPVHPRTATHMRDLGIAASDRLLLLQPLEYLSFIDLQEKARLVITDSGGVQEETSVLGVPCVTYRANTERPITITHGTNELVGVDPDTLLTACVRRLAAAPVDPPSIPLWDGSAGERGAAVIEHFLSGSATHPQLLASP